MQIEQKKIFVLSEIGIWILTVFGGGGDVCTLLILQVSLNIFTM